MNLGALSSDEMTLHIRLRLGNRFVARYFVHQAIRISENGMQDQKIDLYCTNAILLALPLLLRSYMHRHPDHPYLMAILSLIVLSALVFTLVTTISMLSPMWYRRLRRRVFEARGRHIVDGSHCALRPIPVDIQAYVPRDEVRRWMMTNLTGAWGVVSDASFLTGPSLWFSNANDALLFKLRWM